MSDLSVLFNTSSPFAYKICPPLVVTAGGDGLAHLLHDGQVKMQIMQRIQARTRDFVGALQMMQVGPGEMAASVAGAGGIQRPGVVAVARIAYLDVAETREKPAIARIAVGNDALEHVHAPAYR